MRENISNADECVALLKQLGFGAPTSLSRCRAAGSTSARWRTSRPPRRCSGASTGARIRVATKYLNLARRFLSGKGLADYRIVESLGATEGTPAAGTADLIVDITTTGATLAANGLKILEDGVILRSQANLVVSKRADWNAHTTKARDALLARLGIPVK